MLKGVETCNTLSNSVIYSIKLYCIYYLRIGEKRNAYRILVGKPEGKRPLGRPRRRWVNNIKMDTKHVFIYRLHNNVFGRTFICILTLLHVSVSLDHHQAG
jgi:hypothetical protein